MRSPGEQFGPYELVRQIAVGGMAEIYLARSLGDSGFEKYVALKMIHPNFSQDRHFVQMLVEEAKISVYLNHVNIAHVFDLGRIGDTYYIAMEFVDGADLYQIMRRITERGMAMPLHVAAYVAREVCAGLDYAHRCRDQLGRPLKIVHRDMSPQNVLISRAGEVKVVDFGIAKAALRAQQTAVGVIKGKYYYMSPEQAWGKPLDHRTDIFSTGVVLYEIIAGQMLYLEEDVGKLLDMVRRADIPPLHRKRSDVSPELEAIVMKAVARDPADRWQSALEFGQAIEQYLVHNSPGFPVSKLQEIVGLVLDGEEETTRVERPGHIEPKSLMSRKDFVSLVDHSVLFSSEAEYSVTDQPSPFLMNAEDDFAEATVISGPPAFDDLASRFVPSDPSLPVTAGGNPGGDEHRLFGEGDDEESTASFTPQAPVRSREGQTLRVQDDSWDEDEAPTRVRERLPSVPSVPPPGSDPQKDWLDALPTPPPPPPAQVPGVPGAPAGPDLAPGPTSGRLVGPVGLPAAGLGPGPVVVGGLPAPPQPGWWPPANGEGFDDVLDPEEQAALAPSRKLRIVGGLVIGLFILAGVAAVLYLFVPAVMGKKSGRLELFTEPSGANVEVDGKSMAKQTPVLIDGLDPNEGHLVLVKKDGYRPERFTIWVDPGEKKVKKVILSPMFKTSGEGRSP